MNVVVSKFGLLWDDDHRGESELRREILNVELDVASQYVTVVKIKEPTKENRHWALTDSGVLCPASTLQRLAPNLRLAVGVVVCQGLKIFRTRLSTLKFAALLAVAGGIENVMKTAASLILEFSLCMYSLL